MTAIPKVPKAAIIAARSPKLRFHVSGLPGACPSSKRMIRAFFDMTRLVAVGPLAQRLGMSVSGHADPDRLALDLYAAVLDGRGMDAALSAIAAALGGTMSIAHFVQLHCGDPTSQGTVATHNIDPSVIDEYQAHWIAEDPWLRAGRSEPEGVVNLTRLVPAETIVGSAIWNDLLARRAPTFQGLSAVVHRPDDVTGVFTVWRSRSDEPFDERAERLFAQLHPHLARALVTASRLSVAAQQVTVLNALRQGVAIIDPSGRLVLANAALAGMAQQADGIGLAPTGLRAATWSGQQALDQAVGMALQATARREGAIHHAGSISLARPSGRIPWFVEVLPLHPDSHGLFQGSSGVVLLVTDGDARRHPSETALASTFGLTSSEAALAMGLLKGLSLAEYAASRRIGIATARTHLARVLAKTGSRRQSDLIARMKDMTA